MEHETWKPVPLYAGFYEVSDLGRIRRIKGSQSTKAGKVLKPSTTALGYLVVTLSRGGKVKTWRLHRIVMAAFCPERGLSEVNHKNGIKTDNRLANLERSTRSENMKHAYAVLGITAPAMTDSGGWPRDAKGRFLPRQALKNPLKTGCVG